MSESKQKINMNELPEHFTEADTELFDDALENIGDMPVTDDGIDRILSRTMRKAGFEMKDITLNGTGIINMSKNNKEDEEKEHKEEKEITFTERVRRTGGIAACFALIIAGVAALIMFWGSKDMPVSPGSEFSSAVTEESRETENSGAAKQTADTVTVPDVNGLTVPEAIDKIKKADLTYKISKVFSDDVEKGKVVKISCEPGSEAERGAMIEIYVSVGEQTDSDEPNEMIMSEEGSAVKSSQTDNYPVMPDLTRLNRDQAIYKMTEARILFRICESFSEKEEKDRLLCADYEAGTKIRPGTVVTLYIGSGVRDPIEVTLNIKLPKGLEGSYNFEVFGEENIHFTETLDDAGKLDGSVFPIKLYGQGKDHITVYVTRQDIDKENFIRYCEFDVDYKAKTATVTEEGFNTKDILDVPGLWDDQ